MTIWSCVYTRDRPCQQSAGGQKIHCANTRRWAQFSRILGTCIACAFFFTTLPSFWRNARATEPQFALTRVIVEFDPGEIELPARTNLRLIPIGEVPMRSEGLKARLQDLGIVSFGILAEPWRAIDPDPVSPDAYVPPLLASFRDIYALRFESGIGLDYIVEQLERLPGVKLVARDPLLSLADPHWPVDTLLTCPGDSCGRNYQWNLENTGGEIYDITCVEGIDIGMRDAWAIQDECEVRIALMDTGVDPDHPDLQANIDTQRGRNFQSETCDTLDWEDYSGHGTKSAGILGALHSADGLGLAGICGYRPVTSRLRVIVPIKIMPPSPPTGDGTAAALISALAYVSRIYPEAPIVVLEVFIEDTAMSKESLQFLSKACWNSYVTGLLLVAAAGNTPMDSEARAVYPAAFEKLTLAAATLGCDGSREQGFWGGTSSNEAPWIDLAAPGSADDPSSSGGLAQIVTTELEGGFAFENDDLFSGTSAAIPHVGGTAGLLASHTSTLSNEDLIEILIRTAMDMDSLGSGGDYGSGLLRADSALALIDSFVVAYDSVDSIGSSTLIDSCVTRRFRNITLANESAYAPDFYSTANISTLAKIYRFETTVDLPENTNSNHTPQIWIRGRNTLSARYLEDVTDRYNGYREPHFAEITSVSAGSATLRGWTYQLWSPNGGCAGAAGDTLWGWFPLRLPLNGSPTIFSFTYLADTTSAGDRLLPGSEESSPPPTLFEDDAGIHIIYDLPHSGSARLVVYDLNGRQIRTLTTEGNVLSSGEILWDKLDNSGHRVGAGFYYGRLEVGRYEQQVRMLVLR